METVLGLDIGGNHSKFALLEKRKNHYICHAGCVSMGPGAPTLLDVMKNLRRDIGNESIDAISVITSYPAGLSLSYRDGLSFVIDKLLQVFPENLIYLADFSGNFHPVENFHAGDDPFIFSATNFFGSAKIGTKLMETGIVVDMGSTSTDILAIKSRKVSLVGPDNMPLKRHLVGEMNWLGSLSTPISLLCRFVPFKGRMVPVSQGNFHIADAFGILYPEKMNIISKIYGKLPQKYQNSYHNITKLINLDPSYVSQKEAAIVAQYIVLKALSKIRDSLFLILSCHEFSIDNTTFLVMGVGKDLFVTPSLLALGARKENILDIEQFVPGPVWPFASSLGIAIHFMEIFDNVDVSLASVACSERVRW